MSKGKLQKFEEMRTFQNVLQPTFQEVFNNDYVLKGKWQQSFFKNNNPVVLELGCGKGEYTCELSILYPKQNFLGIDIKGARIWKGARRAWTDQMTNVGFLRTHIDFIGSFFGPDEVHSIWITFPDPQPKKPKKRLVSSHFLNKYQKLLHESGWINLKTDSHELFNYCMQVIKYNNLEMQFSTTDLYHSEFKDESLMIKTFYEEVWLAQNLKIHFVRFRLRKNYVIEEPPENE